MVALGRREQPGCQGSCQGDRHFKWLRTWKSEKEKVPYEILVTVSGERLFIAPRYPLDGNYSVDMNNIHIFNAVFCNCIPQKPKLVSNNSSIFA